MTMSFVDVTSLLIIGCIAGANTLNTLTPSCRGKRCNMLCRAENRKKLAIGLYQRKYNDYIGFPFQRPHRVLQVDNFANPFTRFECGIQALIHDHVTGLGQIAAEKTWPWHAVIVGPDRHCAGTLISEHWVLTVPSCAKEVSEVHLGRLKLNATPFNQVRKVEKTVFHEEYEPRTQHNSIALLRLDSPAVFTEHVKPICLPLDEIDPEGDVNCFVTGFGLALNASRAFPDFLQHKAVRVMRQDWCTFTWNMVGFFYDKRNLCTEIEDSSVCDGEIGDPLTCQVGGTFYLVGLFCNRHTECKKGFVPDVFIRISEYNYWIFDSIANNG